MDVLTDLVERTRARGSLFAHSVLHAPWGFRFSAEPAIQFHVVLRGSCYLRRDAGQPLVLHQGDVAFIVVEDEYELIDGVSSPVTSFAPFQRAARAEGGFVWPGPGDVTKLLCGAYNLDGGRTAPLLAYLPPVLHVEASESHRQPALRSTLALLTDELQHRQPGAQLVADRLVDALLVHVLRSWLATSGAALPPWASTARDPMVVAVLELVHGDPGRDWTVETLAREARLSRSAFARRFSVAMGEPPMAYVTRVRMTVAAELLRESDVPVSIVAQRAGYDSVFAFSTAFKRAMGRAPTHFRGTSHRPSTGLIRSVTS